jgi:glycerophosphoryl diester phosphodiesterase
MRANEGIDMKCRVRALVFLITVLPMSLLAEDSRNALPRRSTWNVRDHVPIEQVVVQAHRGAGELAPENTIEAFELGWNLNCIPEADIRTTRDGVIVAFHDSDFSRVVKEIAPERAKLGVKDITFAELEKLDVGSWKGNAFQGRRVSRIADVFAVMKNDAARQLYLDIKNVDLKQLAEEVKLAGVEKQVILASSKYVDDIRAWKALLPDSQTLLWIGGTPEAQKKKFDEARAAGFADLTQLQIHVRLPEGATTVDRNAANCFVQSDDFLIGSGESLREHGVLFQTLPWGGATKEVYWKLLDLGLMSFATDHPDVTRDAIKAYYAEKK